MPAVSQARGDDTQNGKLVAVFRQALDRFAEHCRIRLEAISEALERSTSQSEGAKARYEVIWRDKLNLLRDELKHFVAVKDVRPSLCVMGKRGQGKTSLLKGWLGSQDGKSGATEVMGLPTGDSDTTFCLVRLTLASAEVEAADKGFFTIDLLCKEDMPDVKTPPSPPSIPSSFSLSPAVDESQVGNSNAAFLICRLPVDGTDSKLCIARHNGVFRISNVGEPLPGVQWYTKQVKIPVQLEDGQSSHAAKVLKAVDIVDAPGADPPQQGAFAEWRMHKNSRVFQVATTQLDVLLIVASLNPDAAQLQYQFQQSIWKPWLQRCQGTGEGRLIVAFTHAAEAFKKSEARLATNRNVPTSQNDDSNFARLILNNVLNVLMTPLDSVQSFISPTDASSWPLILFSESKDSELEKYRAGIEPGKADLIASKLSEYLKQKIPDTLPIGQKCILQMVQDWTDTCNLSQVSLERVQRWLIRALCSVLDPADRGYARLTEIVTQYATWGPVLVNHVKERQERAESLARRLRGLLDDFQRPAGAVQAMEDLRTAQVALQVAWKKYPYGPELCLGAACQNRRESLVQQSNALSEETVSFTPDNAIQDVVEDAIGILADIAQVQNPCTVDTLRRVLAKVLSHDKCVRALSTKLARVIRANMESLMRLQIVAAERLLRVTHYLAIADETQLRAVANHCFEFDMDEGDLLRPLLESHIGLPQEQDSKLLNNIKTTTHDLLAAVQKSPFANPYVS